MSEVVSMAFVAGIMTLIFGVLVLAFPGLLRWIIGLYLILTGAIMIFGL